MAEIHSSISLRAFRSVGSFLGVTDQDQTQQQWQCLNEERAKQGQIGLVLAPKKSVITQATDVDDASDSADDKDDEPGRLTERLSSQLVQIIDDGETDRLRIESLGDARESVLDLHVGVHDRSNDAIAACAQQETGSHPEDDDVASNADATSQCPVASASGPEVFKHHFRRTHDPFRKPSVSFSLQLVRFPEYDKNRELKQKDSPGTDIPTPDAKPSKSVLKNKLQEKDSSIETKQEDILTDTFLYRTDALRNYQSYIKMERQKRLMDLLREKNRIKDRLTRKLELIKDMLKMARLHYFGKHGNPEPRWRQLVSALKIQKSSETRADRVSSDIYVRRQLESLPEYTPWFTYFICTIQLLVCVVLMAFGGVTTIGLEPTLKLKTDVDTLLGTETKEHWQIHNIWIGPSQRRLISMGAVFAPCMREDISISYMYSLAYNDSGQQLGCCESDTWDIEGTMHRTECQNATGGLGKWSDVTTCDGRPSLPSRASHRLRPCCYGLLGQCQLTTFEHCVFLEGNYHGEGPEHCSQVNCLSALCGMGGLVSVPDRPYLPKSPSQGYRLLLAPFYHSGVIHMVMVVGLLFFLARPIEKVAGWLRMMCLFFIPAYMGILAGAVMTPYAPHVGGEGGLFGLVAVVCVDLVQSWRLVPRPWGEVGKLTAAALLFLVAGTLPYVDNYTLLTGFVFGILCGIVFLPYVTFGDSSATARRIVIAVTVPVIVFVVFVMFYLFYVVQGLGENCSWCQYVNCLPYTDTMCKMLELW